MGEVFHVSSVGELEGEREREKKKGTEGKIRKQERGKDKMKKKEDCIGAHIPETRYG